MPVSEPPLQRPRIGPLGGAGIGVAIGVVALAAIWPRQTVSAPSQPPVAVASPSVTPSEAASPEPTPTRRPLPTSVPTPSPTPTPTCALPETLPPPMDPALTPVIAESSVTAVFSSPLYRRDPSGDPVALDNPANPLVGFGMGLWHVNDAGGLRLLASNEAGMVLPLAMSGDGRHVAVWWLPSRRGVVEPACVSGIYRLSLVDGWSRLLLSGDWTIDEDTEGPGTLWNDPYGHTEPRRYLLPNVSFSANGDYYAIRQGDRISLFAEGSDDEPLVHRGSCPRWAWSATGATFVAGCADMTTAWLVRADDGMDQDEIAIPYPPDARRLFDDPSFGRDIGLTADGEVRVARFHGIATGCESPDCTLPPMGYSVTTIDPATGTVSHVVEELDGLVEGYDQQATWLADRASWVYSLVEGARPYVIGIDDPSIDRGKRVRPIAAGLDGLVYGFEPSLDELSREIWGVDAAGESTLALAVAHPAGTAVFTPEYLTIGLVLASTGS